MKFVLSEGGLVLQNPVKEAVKEAMRDGAAEAGKLLIGWAQDALLWGWRLFVEYSSGIFLFAALVLILFVMFGSKRAAQWLYWDIALYLILNILGAVTGT